MYDESMLPIRGVRWHTFNNYAEAQKFVRWVKTNYGKRYTVTVSRDGSIGEQFEVRVANW